MSLVEIIQKLCAEKGTNLANLQKELGFGNGSIYRWDKSSPSVDKLQKVAEYFNVSTDYLIYGKEEKISSDSFPKQNGKITATLNLQGLPIETQVEIAGIFIDNPTIEGIINKLNKLSPEKQEVILKLIETID